MKTKVAGILANAALLLASCLAGLLLCEAGLRLFHPKYAYLAESPFIRDPNLLRMRIPDNRSFSWHRDTGARHPFFHNNLGLRQHRDFSAEDLENSVNIGFFGDSFTENTGIKAQYSFTEPLDYLLNIGAGEGNKEGGVNVLNFGVNGYGTAQSLLRYELLDFRQALDHVFYIYCGNDPLDNLASGLFRLDDAGQWAKMEALQGRFTLVSKLHLPYLVLDAAGRLSAHLEELKIKARRNKRKFDQHKAGYGTHGLPSSAFHLFRQMLRRWKEAAESNGATFRLVWLPMEDYDFPGVAAIVEEEGVETLNLRDCFGERDPAHLRTPWELSPYRFEPEHDGHWNEAGNRLAAVCLHRLLEGDLGLPRLSEEVVELALRRYYSAFEAPASPHSPASPQAEAIRRKYLALERGLRPWVLSPEELMLRARFDLYLHNGWLAYVKEGCAQADSEDRFFLHVFPADVQDLPRHRREHGFDNLDFSYGIDEATCTMWRKLPSYAIDRIRTGQFSGDAERGYNNLWKAEISAAHLAAAPPL